MLNIDKTYENGVAELKLGGRLDTITAPELDQAIKTLPEETEELVLNMEKLEYVSSAGLRVLLAGHKKMAEKSGMKVCCVNETIMEIFAITGFADVLTIE